MGRANSKHVRRRARKIGNAHIFEAVLPRNAALRTLVDDFLGLFGGRTQPVMAQLIESGKLTLDDIQQAEKALRKASALQRAILSSANFLIGNAVNIGGSFTFGGTVAANSLTLTGSVNLSSNSLTITVASPLVTGTISFGKERPTCTEATEGCYQRNRRAHFSAGQ